MEETLTTTTQEALAIKQEVLAKRKNNLRNKPCPCGSNLKFKKCCWSKMIKYSNLIISEVKKENDPRNQS